MAESLGLSWRPMVGWNCDSFLTAVVIEWGGWHSWAVNPPALTKRSP